MENRKHRPTRTASRAAQDAWNTSAAGKPASAAASAMLARLVTTGIVGAADLTGFHAVIAGEC